MADFYLKVGDTLPSLSGVLLNPDLSAVDLTDAVIELRLLQMATSLVRVLPSSVQGDDPTLGLVQHFWQTGETDDSGAYFYHWLVTWPGRQESFPNDSRGLVLSIEA